METNRGTVEEALHFNVIDGSHLRHLVFQPHLPPSTGAAITDAVAAAAAPALKGFRLPEKVLSAALGLMPPDFLSSEFLSNEANEMALLYLDAVAAQLQDEPIVISVLNGQPIQVILDDEDDYAMLAEHLFTDLDDDDTGKVCKDEIKTSLENMGIDLGVPPISAMNHLLSDILKKHGAEGKEELGQAQFAQLLQLVLQDLTDALSKNPVTFIHDVKILNGSKIRKILADPRTLDAMVEEMHKVWEAQSFEDGNIKSMIDLLNSRCLQLGLPSAAENQTVSALYQQILVGMKKQIDGELDMPSFKEVVMCVLEKVAAQLEATPIFY